MSRIAVFLATAALCALSAQQHDLLLKGGHLIDPKNNIDARMDIAVRGGRVSAVAADIPPSTAPSPLSPSHRVPEGCATQKWRLREIGPNRGG